MDSNCVKLATEQEALNVLNQPGVLERLPVKPEKIHNGQCFLVNNQMLFILISQDGDGIEAHIACPKTHWKNIHSLIDAGIQFICKIGYNAIYTNVTEHLKTTQNLIMKHGFKEIGRNETERFYKWESVRH